MILLSSIHFQPPLAPSKSGKKPQYMQVQHSWLSSQVMFLSSSVKIELSLAQGENNGQKSLT
jgi:hypothetical protein